MTGVVAFKVTSAVTVLSMTEVDGSAVKTAVVGVACDDVVTIRFVVVV